jgi:hypothetical protein
VPCSREYLVRDLLQRPPGIDDHRPETPVTKQRLISGIVRRQASRFT